MKLDRRDIELLRLAVMYRHLPVDLFEALGFDSVADEVRLLTAAGIVKTSRDKKYIRPAPQTYELLQKYGYSCGSIQTDKPYSKASSLHRRLETSSIMLTALRAGISTLPADVDALAQQPMFYPSFEFRGSESNLMNAANCAAFGNWGNVGYMLQFISANSFGMYLTNELRHLHNLSSIFSSTLKTPLAMIFAGISYTNIYVQLHSTQHSPRHGKNGFHDFWDVYQKTEMPIHLLSCDETGATQLALMRQTDHKPRIAKAALGKDWTAQNNQIPEADGCVGATPLIIAADMDVRRVLKVCDKARNLGQQEVMLAALESQVEEFYPRVLPHDGLVTFLSIDQALIDEAFGGDFSLYAMEED
ncbi:MAG: hypothetical protein FWB75_09380 [Oscillospiraceae bacterium]|nr:hypothetical protein [Oscillospiraceae bacterium]